jgi:ferrochelatase
VEHHYSVIGGGSPIRRHTEQQARALEQELSGMGIQATCVVAMRYWHPFTSEAIAKLEAAAVDEIVLLPLYPQYSATTTGSSLNEWNRCFQSSSSLPVYGVREFYRHPIYVEAVAEKVAEALQRFPRPQEATLVFSAHSVPLAVVAKGDPYQAQIEETVGLVRAQGAFRNSYRLCYQSKVGASKWLQPSLRITLRELAAAGVRQICVVPISFVSDHVETLGEVDHEAREQARELGFTQFEMSAGLNDSPTFIAALADLVATAIGVPQCGRSGTERLVAAD